MNPIQKRALKRRFRSGVKMRKVELRKLTGAASRFHFKGNRFFKSALSNVKKEIRLYNRLGLKIR